MAIVFKDRPLICEIDNRSPPFSVLTMPQKMSPYIAKSIEAPSFSKCVRCFISKACSYFSYLHIKISSLCASVYIWHFPSSYFYLWIIHVDFIDVSIKTMYPLANESVAHFCLKGKLLRGIRNCFVYLGSKWKILCRNPSTKHVCNYNPYLDTNRNILTWIPISNLNLDIVSVLNKYNITWLIYRTLR